MLTIVKRASRAYEFLVYAGFMPNPYPRLSNLNPEPPKWKHQPTAAIRIPEVFRDEIADFARKLDNGDSISPEPGAKIISRPSATVWLGIKPSISRLGWAVLEGDTERGEPDLLDYGTIVTAPEDPLPKRLAEIESDLMVLLEEFRPGHVALEIPFINNEYPSGRKTLQALGVINSLIYRTCHFLPVNLHTGEWKSHLDSPRAERADIAAILECLFNLKHFPANVAADATGIAYAAWCGLGSI
ncbi:MAG: Crossover junction endodeoxyribonuclease RuvC (plasmid) [Chroococcopsis gigantea SAG 12.99]|jgi:crossover junction endodeoxyribonuclease RuvC|nr:Crossover junction endodeoxyribonuclease RuvC [Chroococcopsis gigantea SAG 12.99]